MAVVNDLGLLCLVVDSREDKKIEGRTKLQKIVYFCQYLDWEINDYRLHYYGPFSFGLANTIKMADDSNFISQTRGHRHTFSITKDGSKFLDAFESKVCNKDKVKKTRMLVSSISNWSREELELAATIDYVYKSNAGITKADLLGKVKTIKSNFSRLNIENAHGKWIKLHRKLTA